MGRMDCDYAIKRHLEPLLVIVASLYAMIGLTEGGMIERLSKRTYRKVLAILRPAESAVRRLIVVMARDLEVEPPADRKAKAKRAGKGKGKGKRKGQSRSSFPLFDPRLRDGGFGRRRRKGPVVLPRIRWLGDYSELPPYLRPKPEPPPAPKPEPDDTVSAKSLFRRLARIKDALSDLPRQALRYARMRAKAMAEDSPKLDTVLRRGPPPGFRPKSRHEVHEILRECQWLARTVAAPDTS
jgi:hypothetical protein